MTTIRCLSSTEPRGVINGTAFEGITRIDNLNNAVIARIIIWHSTYIHALQIHYAEEKEESVRRGRADGTMNELVLDPFEYITMIEGAAGNSWITRLTFTTNKRKWGPFGGCQGEFFIWRAADRVLSHQASRMRLLCFRGYSDTCIRRLQATFAEHPFDEESTKIVKYECTSQPANATTSVAPPTLSKFGIHIMSRVTKLCVGKGAVKFQAHHSILTQLPFFRAALNGEFREASEKAITMPEDEPVAVSALIEFLYTGGYTYTYHANATPRPLTDTTDIPVSDLKQGSFHVSVYAVAAKYDCPTLAGAAAAKFRDIMQELPNIDIIRLWKIAYDKDLTVPKWGTGGDATEFRERLSKLVTILYSTHHEKMASIMAEYPALACDLLCIAAGSNQISS